MNGITSIFGVEFGAMASPCEVRLVADSEAEGNRLANEAADEVRRIESKYSRYRSDSVISRINAAAGLAWVDVDQETQALFGYADALYEASGGLFDITSGVLRRAWDFLRPVLPAPDELQSLLALIGWQTVWRLNRDGQPCIRLPQPGMEIDFGGFGKEYAADRAAAMLIEQGVQFGYVNLGGDLRIIGPQPNGKPWDIGIQDPRDNGKVAAVIPVQSGALATSGDYERFFELDGKRYCHILNPHSGQPVQGWRSVSVLAPLAVVAGSYATIAMLKGASALTFLEESRMAFLAIDEHGHRYARNGWRPPKSVSDEPG